MLKKYFHILIYFNLTLFLFSFLISPFRSELDTEILQLNDNGIVVLCLILGINLFISSLVFFYLKSDYKLHYYTNIFVGIIVFIKIIWLVFVTNF